jgi:sulfur relay (sulfurtransferase) complex TusBCD TusD component (DsrE family)
MHQAVQQLVREEGVPVHVCGTHAEWRGVTAEQFPEYVDVAAAGPAQINDYRALGYALVVVSD